MIEGDSIRKNGVLYVGEMNMIQGHFYFLKDSYCTDFPDPNIQRNHESVGGVVHDKPCFFAIPGSVDGIYWVIPISSQTNKYHRIANGKIQRYGRCDTIVFGEVLGKEKAFLIQNMIPITEKYVKNEYRDGNGVAVRVDGRLERMLVKRAKAVLEKQRHGLKLIFPNVFQIEADLIRNLNKAKPL